MDYRRGQKKQSLILTDYVIRICVNGTRRWGDKKRFHKELIKYLERFDDNVDILFISGAAYSGADDFIISWCKKFGYPCKKYPADWDALGKSAGRIRNTEMSQVSTHLLSYWDGKSTGTKDAIDKFESSSLPVKIIRIDQDEEDE